MMHIGEFGERTGMSHRTIRHYDEVGLLQPSGRTSGGFRLYTGRDVEEMLLIRRMKPLGYSLEEMGRLLEAFRSLREDPTATAKVEQEVQALLGDAEERRRRLRRNLEWADEFIEVLGNLMPARRDRRHGAAEEGTA